jgi:acyl-CoA thioesterase-2
MSQQGRLDEPRPGFAHLLGVEPVGDDAYRGMCHVGERHAYGGHVAAHAVMAAFGSVPGTLHAHSMHGYFLRPGMIDDPIIYSVERLRDGATFATRRVVASQGGRPIFTMTASFKQFEEIGGRQLVMPTVPEPEQLADPYAAWAAARPDEFAQMRFTKLIQMRFVPPDQDRSRTGMSEQTVWLRATLGLSESPRVHTAALVYLSDLMMASTAALEFEQPRPLRNDPGSAVLRASLDHSVWIHRPIRADEWMLVVLRSPSHSDGRALTFSEIWSRRGDLVASAAQETLIRPGAGSTP